MAQTQKYEKIVILNSSSDNDIYPENTSTRFTNRVYPISESQTYDAVFPMMTSIPISLVPEPSLYILNEEGRKYFDPEGISGTRFARSFKGETSDGKQEYGQFAYWVSIRPTLDVRNKQFFTKQETLLNFLISYNFNIAHVRSDPLTKEYIVLTPNENPIIASLQKGVNIGDHYGFDILPPYLEWQADYECPLPAGGRITAKVGFLPVNSNEIMLKERYEPKDCLSWNNTWTHDELQSFCDKVNQVPREVNLYKVWLRTFRIDPIPSDIWITLENQQEAIDDDNQQIYVHSEDINLTRIANQNEPIFQDLFISGNATDSGRITEYLSIPNFIPLTLNTPIVGDMTFELLNAVGERNVYIDRKRSTIIVCKLIKKYYDFSDAKKKTYITNLLTY